MGLFGNGKGDGGEPQDTRSLWGDMLGIGPLMKVLTDPALQAHTHAMMSAVIEGANATRRVEAKLDRLLRALGHEIGDINAKFPSPFQPASVEPGDPFSPAALLIPHGADGAGGHAAAARSPDDGSGVAPASVVEDRRAIGDGGGRDRTAGARP